MDRPLRIALVGGGYALHTQLPALRLHPRAHVTTLVGRDASRTRSLAARHAIARASTDLAAVLDQGDIDLVCVSTPVDRHRAQVELCLQRGVDVLCEKPMALDAGEAASMQRAAVASGRCAFIDHQLRYCPNLVHMQRLLQDGFIGHPLHVELVLRTGSRLDRRRRHDWWSERRRGGGVLGALGSHVIDLLRWQFGPVERACGIEHTFIAERPVEGTLERRPVDADDHASFCLVLGPRPVVANVTVSVVAHAAQGLRFEVFGDAGMLCLDEDTNLWGSRRDPEATRPADSRRLERLDAPDPVTRDDMRAIPDGIFGRSFVLFARALVDGLRDEARPWQESALGRAATFADGLEVQRVLDALRLSHRERRWVACGA